MSLTKRINGRYTISSSDDITLASAGNVNISGNLIVAGTTTTVNSTDTEIADKLITLNKGESGTGVQGDTFAGIEIDRGSAADVALRWNDTTDTWQATVDGSTYYDLVTTATLPPPGIFNIVEDTTPQLGGNLDVNGKTITSTAGGDVTITTDGTGQLKLNKVVSIQDQGSAPSATAGYNKLYSSSTQGGGGTGLYFVNSTTTDELASRTKAIVYSLIF
jgi:hypothetical protein